MFLLLASVAFIIIFTSLILIHEWGHFVAARFFGVKVEEFGLGLPPRARALHTDKKGTTYTLNWLPLGGFVRMHGEDFSAHNTKPPAYSFSAKPVWQRMIIILAGVFMNALLALLLVAISLFLGRTIQVPVDEVAALQSQPYIISSTLGEAGLLVLDMADGYHAQESGIQPYDLITSLHGQPVTDFQSFRDLAAAHAGESVTLTVTRRSIQDTLTVPIADDGKLGLMLSSVPFQTLTLRYTPSSIPSQTVQQTAFMTQRIVAGVGTLFGSLVRFHLPEDIGGPVKVAQETYNNTASPHMLIMFAAMLSLTLAVFNILPIPALDGGKFLFLAVEALRRKPLSPLLEARIHAGGYLLLMSFILLITLRDLGIAW